jgi:hypothetical protein
MPMTSTIATATRTALPANVRRAQFAVFAVAAIHVLALLLVLTHRDVIAAALAAQHPGADTDALAGSAVLQSAIPHVVLAILLPLRAWRVRDGQRRSRLILTIVLIVQLAAHATLPMVLAELPGYGAWVIAVQAVSLVFEVAALCLLWTAQSKVFFNPAAKRELAAV